MECSAFSNMDMNILQEKKRMCIGMIRCYVLKLLYFVCRQSADDDQRERGKSSFQFVVDCGWNMMTIMMGRRFIYRKKYNVENARKPSSVLCVLF